MRVSASLLLVLTLAADARPQEPGTDLLTAACRDLEAGDPRRVFAAVQAIANLGGAWLPAIEARARESKGRVRDYLELAAEEIRMAPHLPGYPLVQRLSMKSTDKNVVDLLSDLRTRTGLPLCLDNLMEEEKLPDLPFDVKDATTLETFDAICHAGNVTVSMQNGQFALFNSANTEYPRFFYGHFMLRLGDFEFQKTVTFRKPATQTFNLHMESVWDPVAAPLRFKPIRVVEALDDRGKNLVPPPPVPDPQAKPGEDPADAEEPGANPFLHLASPSPTATKITLVRGFVTVVLPKTRLTAVFTSPQVDQVSVAGDYHLKITAVDLEHHVVVLQLSSKKHKPEAINAMDVISQVALRDWEATGSWVEKQSWSEEAQDIAVSYEPLHLKEGLARPADGAPPSPVDRLEVSIVTAVQDKRIPFEFRDLKLR